MIAYASLLILSFALLAPPAKPDVAAEIALARQAWIDDLETKKVEASVALYTDDADFLDPSGARFHGSAELRKLYNTVTSGFDADCHMTSRTVETSGDLAFDSGEYDEDITVRATGAKNHFKGSYLTVYRRVAGKWLIVQQAWTEAKPQ